jgi:hypothetical protein
VTPHDQNPADYCSDCAELLEALDSNDDACTCTLPENVRFDTHLSNTAIWHKGDVVETIGWSASPPKHMMIHNKNRRRQAYARLCTKPLRTVLERLTRSRPAPGRTGC